MLRAPELLEIIEASLRRSQTTFTVADDRKPFLLTLDAPGGRLRVRVYIWTITHGGATRSPEEFRVQVTPSMQPAAPGEATVVLGWSPDWDVFAAWDPNRHSQRTSSSPSLQISQSTMQAASAAGLQAETRGSGDVVVAFQPALLGAYLESLEQIHLLPQRVLQNTLSLSPEPVDTSSLEELDADLSDPGTRERQFVVTEVRKRFRNASFGSRVRQAYGGACAICGIQLFLVEAAHIVPVSSGYDLDVVQNGMALCRNHHKAYDSNLLSVQPDYTVVVSRTALLRLQDDAQGAGTEVFADLDGRPLESLPVDEALQPLPDYLLLSQEVRRFER